jgi:hypothetical protein
MTMPAKKPAKKLDPSARVLRFGILNQVGAMWTYETFDTEKSAEHYLALKRITWPSARLKHHKVVPVRVTITPIIERQGKAKP